MNKLRNDLRARANDIASPNTFTAATIHQIYRFPQPSPNPVTVSVISFGGGLFGNLSNTGVLTNGDVHAYWTSLGMAAADHPKVIILPIEGATNAPVSGDNATYENTVDVAMIGGCCATPNLTILLIIAPNDLYNFPALITKATEPITVNGVTYSPSVVSISWGAPEPDYGVELLTRINTVFRAATAKGINFCAATGDLGSTDGVPGTKNYVDFPSSSPYVTACGGTSLICPTLNYDDTTTVETAWPKGGGGTSEMFPKPTWQTGLSGAIGANRCIPDISLNSDPMTGVDYIIEGKHYIYGGTSIAAPTMAAFYALLNTNKFLLPSLYAAHTTNPLSFHDITVGSNGGYTAAVGFDLVTGFGSIAGNILTPLLMFVQSIPVTGIMVDKTSLSLMVGKKVSITATILPANATNPAMTWSSSDPTIATVELGKCSGAMACGCASSCTCGCATGAMCNCIAQNTGVVTGIAPGTALITVTTVDGGFTASTEVSITIPPTISVTGVSVDKTNVTLILGNQTQLTATVSPANATNPAVTWSSSSLYAVVSNTGLVTAMRVGMVLITATTVDGGFTASTMVTITAAIPVTGVTLDKTNLTLTVGNQTQLKATVSPPNATNPAVTWSSSSPPVTVSSKGLVTAISVGTAMITVTTVDGGWKARATVTVSSPAPLVSIRFSPSVILLYTYYTYQSNLVFNPLNATTPVTYSSSNPRIASVNATGLISTYNPGTITILARTAGGLSASLTVYVFGNYQYYAFRPKETPNKVRKYTDTNATYSMPAYRR